MVYLGVTENLPHRLSRAKAEDNTLPGCVLLCFWVLLLADGNNRWAVRAVRFSVRPPKTQALEMKRSAGFVWFLTTKLKAFTGYKCN